MRALVVAFSPRAFPSLAWVAAAVFVFGAAALTASPRSALAAANEPRVSAAAAACGCKAVPTVAQARSKHGFVFIGLAISVTDSTVSVTRDSSITLSRAVFRVRSLWKGLPRHALTVTSGRPSRACAYPFEPGGMYLVYADGKTGFDLVTSVCTRTTPYDSSSAEIKALGTPAIVPRFP
ncbi:MAG: hypothetical protein ACREOU_13325 [Candidatus Eiseniibacteriota bacterium]